MIQVLILEQHCVLVDKGNDPQHFHWMIDSAPEMNSGEELHSSEMRTNGMEGILQQHHWYLISHIVKCFDL
jgi:hypothetical protein